MNSGAESWTEIGVVASCGAVVLIIQGLHVRNSKANWGITLFHILQEVRSIYKTCNQLVVYEGVIPAAQHRAISKLARKTNHIERFNNTLRQCVSRLVREALSFSRSSPTISVSSSSASATTI